MCIRRLSSLVAVVCSCALATPAGGQPLDPEAGKTDWLVVMVRGELNGESTIGAGILFGRDAERAYVVTANHVVRRGELAATRLQILLRGRPEQWIDARLTAHFDPRPPGLDLAVLEVESRGNRGLVLCDLPLDRLPRVVTEEQLVARGAAVYPVGYPHGVPWGTPVAPDRVSGVVGGTITFQSAFIIGGHSGGALLTAGGDLLGLITSDQPPYGVAIQIGRVLELLRRWNYPVYLHQRDALHKAVIQGRMGEQRRLLEQCPDTVNRRVDVEMNGINWTECTPLHMAALLDQPAAVRLLLDYGADTSVECSDSFTPLELAVRFGVAQVAESLLTHARPNTRRLNYLLRVALAQKDLANMQVLVEHGADVRHASGHAMGAPLHDVASWTLSARESSTEQREDSVASHVAAAKFLLAHDASVDQQDSYGRTALHVAVEINHSFHVESQAVPRLLLESGASINKPDRDGDTPLHVAAFYKNVEAVKVLVEYGADVNRGNNRGQTPLHRALAADRNYGYRHVDENSVLGIVALLVEAGADVNALTTGGHPQTPLSVGVPYEAVREYLRLLGALRSHKLDDEAALRNAREAVRRAPGDAGFQIYSGKALRAIGRLGPALAAVLEALRLDRDEALALEPALAAWLVDLGYSLNMLARYEQGLRAADAAIRLDPNEAYAYGNKAFALGHLGRDVPALDAARAGVELLAEDAAVWAMLGFAENLVGSFQESIAAFEKALLLEPLYFENTDLEHKAQLKALDASRRGQRYLP